MTEAERAWKYFCKGKKYNQQQKEEFIKLYEKYMIEDNEIEEMFIPDLHGELTNIKGYKKYKI